LVSALGGPAAGGRGERVARSTDLPGVGLVEQRDDLVVDVVDRPDPNAVGERVEALVGEVGLVAAVAAVLEPDAQMAPELIEALASHGLSKYTPRAVTSADLATASRVITFNLASDELLIASSSVERWDDVPAVSENLRAARGAVRHHLDCLIEGYSGPAAG
jgi:predicted GTPase